jgi:hypothetical protein
MSFFAYSPYAHRFFPRISPYMHRCVSRTLYLRQNDLCIFFMYLNFDAMANPQSTCTCCIPRVPKCLSPRPNWNPPPPPARSPARECIPPQNQRGGGHHSPAAGERVAGSNSFDWRKSLALCLNSLISTYSLCCKINFFLSNVIHSLLLTYFTWLRYFNSLYKHVRIASK